jgi:hypothetical protein
MLGEHRVSIKATRVHVPASGGRAVDSAAGSGPTVEWLIPKRYERPETSRLTATVHSGKNTIDFDLPVER